MKRLEAMREGGKRLGEITENLFDLVKVGSSPKEIEIEAQKLIKKHGGTPSFQTVRDYKWATCITINEGVVHGIPESEDEFIDGDVVMVDVGFFYEDHHTDNAFTKVTGKSESRKDKFLQAGKDALRETLSLVKPGAHTGELSQKMQQVVEGRGYSAARGLTGHGIGKILHEEPMIPCHIEGNIENTPKMRLGQTLAVEVIYIEGKPDLVGSDDGWTISTKDGTLSAVFEETVEVTNDGHSILTEPALFQR